MAYAGFQRAHGRLLTAHLPQTRPAAATVLLPWRRDGLQAVGSDQPAPAPALAPALAPQRLVRSSSPWPPAAHCQQHGLASEAAGGAHASACHAAAVAAVAAVAVAVAAAVVAAAVVVAVAVVVESVVVKSRLACCEDL